MISETENNKEVTDMFHDAANDNQNWVLEIETHTREQLIDVSSFIARAIRPDFFHDPVNIPYIIVPGDGGGGKCMVVEAMMKTLLDQYDPEDMKRTGAPQGMFIEREPMDACNRYCSAFGSTADIPVMYGFDRSTYRHDRDLQQNLEENFRQAAQFQRSDGPWPVGAIFCSGVDIGNSQPWIVIHLELDRSDDSKMWDRKLQIEIRNNRLKTCPQFQAYWKQLQVFQETGALIEPTIYEPKAVKGFGKILSLLGQQGLAVETSLEGALLATLLEYRKQLGITDQEIIETVRDARNEDNKRLVPPPLFLRK